MFYHVRYFYYIYTMKHIKLYEEFLNKGVSNITAYHTSGTKISSFKPASVWVTTNLEFAKAYQDNAIDEGRDAYTYEIRVSGNILTQDAASELSETLGIDFEDLIADLTGNPDVKERTQLIKPFIGKCDGFFHWDYDPRDWGDGESLLVFNPAKHAKIIKQIY